MRKLLILALVNLSMLTCIQRHCSLLWQNRHLTVDDGTGVICVSVTQMFHIVQNLKNNRTLFKKEVLIRRSAVISLLKFMQKSITLMATPMFA